MNLVAWNRRFEISAISPTFRILLMTALLLRNPQSNRGYGSTRSCLMAPHQASLSEENGREYFENSFKNALVQYECSKQP